MLPSDCPAPFAREIPAARHKFPPRIRPFFDVSGTCEDLRDFRAKICGKSAGTIFYPKKKLKREVSPGIPCKSCLKPIL